MLNFISLHIPLLILDFSSKIVNFSFWISSIYSKYFFFLKYLSSIIWRGIDNFFLKLYSNIVLAVIMLLHSTTCALLKLRLSIHSEKFSDVCFPPIISVFLKLKIWLNCYLLLLLKLAPNPIFIFLLNERFAPRVLMDSAILSPFILSTLLISIPPIYIFFGI